MTTLPALRGMTLSALCLSTTLLLSACGGSSGSSSPDNGAPVNNPVGEPPAGGGSSDLPITAPKAVKNFTLTPKATKTLQFSWDDVADETEYRLLENPDGSSGFEQIATITADSVSYDHVVSLPARINAQYILQSCNAVGCSDSATVSVTTSLASAVGYVKASNTGADDYFGTSISMSSDGDTLAVGAPGEDGRSGGVYVFKQTDGAWAQEAYIKASNAHLGDSFGISVGLSADGNTLAVGAHLEDSSATGINGNQSDDSAIQSGAVYVYSRNSSAWSQEAYLKASNTEATDKFGIWLSIAADGNTLAVGAFGESGNGTSEADNSVTESGAVYVFARSGITWSQQAYLKASSTGVMDWFGYALSLSGDGNTLAVGALNDDSSARGINGDHTDDSASNSGAVYVFTRSGVTWNKEAYIKASNTDWGDFFGHALSLSGDGNTLAVSAFREGSSATGIGGNQSDKSAVDSGAVYLFTRSAGIWSQDAYIKASNTETRDAFGYALSLSADGNALAVSAIAEASVAGGINGNQNDNSIPDSGAIYLYTRDSGSSWIYKSYIKASNSETDDNFGWGVSLSDDGSTLAVSARHEDGHVSGVNGGDQADNSASNSGAVYLY